MKRLKSWMNSPMTWGGYFRLQGIRTAISAVSTVVFAAIIRENLMKAARQLNADYEMYFEEDDR